MLSGRHVADVYGLDARGVFFSAEGRHGGVDRRLSPNGVIVDEIMPTRWLSPLLFFLEKVALVS
jgi:hypothetical protein